jgi:hypothetical protein
MTVTTPRKYESVKESRRRNGNISNSQFYEILAEGRIRVVKLGRRTLVDVESADAYFASLPRAKFRLPKGLKATDGAGSKAGPAS